MKILILFPGKIKPRALAAAQEEYIKRLQQCGVEVVEYKNERVIERNPVRTKKIEAERIFKLLKKNDYLIACDERGKSVQTPDLVELIRSVREGGGVVAGFRRIVLVIGGSLGFSEELRHKANEVWKLSSLVMAGGIARLVLLEGLYRAVSIVNGHPYHNE